MAQLVKNLPGMRETWVQSLHWEDALEKGKGDINHLDLTEDTARVLIICGRMQGVL